MTETPTESKCTLFSGNWFVFEEQGHRIALWRSSWTSREKVWVDGQLVSDKKASGYERWHEFQRGADAYRLETRSEGFWVLHHECTLSKNALFAQRKSFVRKSSVTLSNLLGFLGMAFMIWVLCHLLEEHVSFVKDEGLGFLLVYIGSWFCWQYTCVRSWWVQDNYNTKPAPGLL